MSIYVDVAYIKVCSIVWKIQYTHTHTVSYRVGSFTLPAVWIESFLLLRQSLGLHGVHPPLLALHLLPLVAQNDADGSGAGKQSRNKD